MQFIKKELIQRNYIIAKALPITKRVKLIDKREFTIAALNKNAKIFVMYIATLSRTSTLVIWIYFF